MANVITYGVTLDATGAINGFKRLDQAIEKNKKEVAGLESGIRKLTGILTGAALGRAALGFVRMADAANLLQGRLRLVNANAGQLQATQEMLFASAQRTRSSYEDLVTLYARVARNAGELGRSQSELLKFTELVTMAIKASGASSSEASAGVIQLAQALASGRLQGDEFRSIMENLPGVARALAQSLGVPIGALRKMAAEGELTADKIVDAVLRSERAIRGDFATAPVTAADGWTRLRNSVLLAAGDFDKVTGVTRAIADALTFWADAIERLVTGNAFAKWLASWNIIATNIATFIANVDLAIYKVNRLFALSDLGIGFGLSAATAGLVGEGIKSRARDDLAAVDASIAETQARLAALAKLKEEQELALAGMGAAARATAADYTALATAAARAVARLDDKAFQRLMEAARQSGLSLSAQNLRTNDFGPLHRTTGMGARGTYVPGDPVLDPRIRAARIAGMREMTQEEIDFANQSAREREQIEKNYLRGIQSNFSSFFQGLATDGFKSLEGLMSSFKNLVVQTFAELAAKRLTESLFGGVGATGFLSKLLGPVGVGLAVGGLALGAIFGGNRGPSYRRHRMPFIGEAERQAARDRLAAASPTGDAESIRQSVGGILTESAAARIVGNLESIRVGIFRLVALAESGAMGGGTTTAQAATPVASSAPASGIAAMVDRSLGSRTALLRLQSGAAVIA